MQHVLENPIWHALLSGNSRLALGNDVVKFFPKEVSPFAASKEWHQGCFSQLACLQPAQSVVVTITAFGINVPQWCRLIHHSLIWQMTGEKARHSGNIADEVVALGAKDVPQMLQLTNLTNPGPFLVHTIEFGNYLGIFKHAAGNKQLAAMVGRRMHPEEYIEVSAVCTHPDFAGQGLGSFLTLYQAQQIKQEGYIPFLHVRKDNENAIRLYQKGAFAIRTDMHVNVFQIP